MLALRAHLRGFSVYAHLMRGHAPCTMCCVCCAYLCTCIPACSQHLAAAAVLPRSGPSDIGMFHAALAKAVARIPWAWMYYRHPQKDTQADYVVASQACRQLAGHGASNIAQNCQVDWIQSLEAFARMHPRMPIVVVQSLPRRMFHSTQPCRSTSGRVIDGDYLHNDGSA